MSFMVFIFLNVILLLWHPNSSWWALGIADQGKDQWMLVIQHWGPETSV